MLKTIEWTGCSKLDKTNPGFSLICIFANCTYFETLNKKTLINLDKIS